MWAYLRITTKRVRAGRGACESTTHPKPNEARTGDDFSCNRKSRFAPSVARARGTDTSPQKQAPANHKPRVSGLAFLCLVCSHRVSSRWACAMATSLFFRTRIRGIGR